MTKTDVNDNMTGASLYAELRRRGEVIVTPENLEFITPARRAARRDGLVVRQHRQRKRPDLPGSQHDRPYIVSLTTDGHTIVTPDAP